MDIPPLVTSAAAHHWLAAHAGQRALARPLVALVAHEGHVRERDVVAQGRRVFGNWRRLARVATDDPARPMGVLLEALLASLLGAPPTADDARDGDAYDLVAFDDAATRVRALAADLPLLGLGHHVLLVNPRRAGRAGARSGARSGARPGLDRWLAIDRREAPARVQLFPSRPGRPATMRAAFGRDAPRPPRVRTICGVRPATADAARVVVVSRWRDEPCEPPPSSAAGRARWRRQHTAIALAAVFGQLVEVEAGSPAVIRT